tara:strand:+ start:894 stop:1388 length:495 start_codon:yes stop_codon:yes gene_type:complete
MGLDMYLKARKHVGGYKFQDEPEQKVFADVIESVGMGSHFDQESPSATVTVTVGYWRKANAIHKWFVDNCQGGVDECQESYVRRDQLGELRSLCLEVLDLVHDGKVDGSQILPTQSGFFFGSTSYDDWYIQDLEATVDIINRALSIPDPEGSFTKVNFYYEASW